MFTRKYTSELAEVGAKVPEVIAITHAPNAARVAARALLAVAKPSVPAARKAPTKTVRAARAPR